MSSYYLKLFLVLLHGFCKTSVQNRVDEFKHIYTKHKDYKQNTLELVGRSGNGRNILTEPNSIEIDGCRYASADRVCQDQFAWFYIMNGTEVQSRDYPFMISLQEVRTDRDNSVSKLGKCYQHFCGGVLIWDDVVLTAAHCIERIIDIRLDQLQPITHTEIIASRESRCRHQNGIEDMVVGWIYAHPNYSADGSQYQNDIALLFLRGRTELREAIIDFSNSLDYEDQATKSGQVQMIGFGLTTLEQNDAQLFDSSSLKLAYTKIRSKEICVDFLLDYGQTKQVWDKLLDSNTMICTLNISADACQGDSGGPLFTTTDDGSYILLGVVSWGPIGYCNSIKKGGAPSIFTRVSYYKDWIKNSINEYSVFPNSGQAQPIAEELTFTETNDFSDLIETQPVSEAYLFPFEQPAGSVLRGNCADTKIAATLGYPNLNIRADSSTSYAILAKIPYGRIVEMICWKLGKFIERSNQWLQVVYVPAGNQLPVTGFVADWYVECGGNCKDKCQLPLCRL